MEATHSLSRAQASPAGMAPNAQMHPQMQQNLSHAPDGPNMMYANEDHSVNALVPPNHHNHIQMPSPHESEELYKRSVMLVIWYKAHTTPLRLLHPLPSFPFLQLSSFPSLLSSLSLSETSFVDAYNPQTGQWEQHMISTVRLVDGEQRILYRLRKSLLEGLSEDECPGIDEEVAMQPHQPHHAQVHPHAPPEPVDPQRAPLVPVSNGANPLKRPAPDSDPSPQATKYYLADIYRGQPQPYAVPVSQPQSYPQNLSTPKGAQKLSVHGTPPRQQSHLQSPTTAGPAHRGSAAGLSKQHQHQHQQHAQGPYTYQQSGLYASPAPPPTQQMQQPQQLQHAHELPAHLHTPPAPIPYHPHPPLKRWPNDYTVSEIALGFKQMDALIAQMPTLTQRAAFERVFGCRYVKSTVCRHRGVWRRAPDGVRGAFEQMGRDERAVWGEFVRRVEGRASGLQGGGEGGSAGEGDAGMHRESAEDAEEAVMGSLGPPPPEHEQQAAHPQQQQQQQQQHVAQPHPQHVHPQQQQQHHHHQQQQQPQHHAQNGQGMGMNGANGGGAGQQGDAAGMGQQAVNGPSTHVQVYDPSLAGALGGGEQS